MMNLKQITAQPVFILGVAAMVGILGSVSCLSAQVQQDTSESSKSSAEPEDDAPIALIDPNQLPASAQPCREPVLVEVQYVIDGDTFHVRGATGEERIRTIGINTPELGYDGDPDDCYAQEAKLKLEELIAGKSIWLSFDETCTDPYDRTLAYVHTGTREGDFIQRRMLRQGYGWAYPFDDTPAFTDIFEEDQDLAQENGSGGWGDCGWY